MKKIIYLTFLESYSGVYQGQVMDSVSLLNESNVQDVELIAFISIRNFIKDRAKLKCKIKKVTVLPMIPKISNWRLNVWLLYFRLFFENGGVIIARNPIACNLALDLKEKRANFNVVYDGRGAVSAESEEYNIFKGNTSVMNEIRGLEKKAVIESDFRISVSRKLVDYWRKSFNYYDENHVVIPCSLSNDIVVTSTEEHKRISKEIREKLGFSPSDIIFVYSGSPAEWQSINLVCQFAKIFLSKNTKNKFIFLSQKSDEIIELMSIYPDGVKNMWVSHSEVYKYLQASDYGLLFREESITNFVASPTKFAEYLSCGLKVLIKGNIGDFNIFIEDNKCGEVINDLSCIEFDFLKIPFKEKNHLKNLSFINFSKLSMNIRGKYSLI